MFSDISATTETELWLEEELKVTINLFLPKEGPAVTPEEVQSWIVGTVRNWLKVAKHVRQSQEAPESLGESPCPAPWVTVTGRFPVDGIPITLSLSSATDPAITAQAVLSHVAAMRVIRGSLSNIQQDRPALLPTIAQDIGKVVKYIDSRAGTQPPQQQQRPQPQNGSVSLDELNQMEFGNDYILATRAPSPNSPQYQDGTLVAFDVYKIEIGTNNGSPIYKLWGKPELRYPLHTVYVTKRDGSTTPDFKGIGVQLKALELDFDNPSTEGRWRVITQVRHANGKEYFNMMGLDELEKV